jgi:hypothetical protein
MFRGSIKEDRLPSFTFSPLFYSLITFLPLGTTEKSSRRTIFFPAKMPLSLVRSVCLP